MKKGQNYNAPARGSRTKVEPIRKMADIRSIKKLLAGNPRDLALFTLGINTNLRASDLVGITAGMVAGIQPGGEIELTEKKTGKPRRITLNKTVVAAIRPWVQVLQTQLYSKNDPLFAGQRGPLTVPSVNRLVKAWCAKINLTGNYGSHTLRKTWGYHQRVTFGVGLPELMTCFNHSSQAQTLTYLCIQPDEIKRIYENEI